MMKKKEIFISLGLILMTILKRMKSDKLVIDTDAGADDAMAILLLLSACANNDTNFDIVAITCTYGNTNLRNVEKNVLKTLTIANQSKIPVYTGAYKPLTHNHTSDNFFGNDGFGDFEFNQKFISNIDRSKHAAIALIDLAYKYPGELNILVLGPTTNIALAISLDPKFVHKIKRFYVMGGSVIGNGNISPGVEFNFGSDAESNFIFFNSTRGEVSLLLPWETNLSINISSLWRKNVLGGINSKFLKFLNKAESKTTELSTWQPCDSLIAAVILCPKLIKKSIVTNITPIMEGEARGGILIDYSENSYKPKNVEIIQDIHVEEFQKILLSYLSYI
ncbi:probable uridine nucleosidase 1 [Rhopalosiphum maidis]|uniref:probable uridine nucleosidase 1 n=1 Tax=Rhopalosiphum maidis TaxID=43146 RepID=UPI000EFEC12C|nr:probable uridine nucleosidase 1 [Rhopalosiphum maidis]